MLTWNRLAALLLLVVLVGIVPGKLSGDGLPKGTKVRATGKSTVRRLEPIRVVEVTPVSPVFLAKSEAAVKSVPERVWQGVQKAGWEVHLAEFVIDARPKLKDSRPRGWPSKMTWSNSDAMNDVANRRVIVAEKRYSTDGRVVPNYRVAGVLRHELGHTFDRVVGGRSGLRSSSAPFMRAYQADLGSLPETRRDVFHYYLQKRSAGRQEAYAEAFAIAVGGGSDGKQRLFQTHFPRVLKLVERDVTTYSPN